MICAQCGSENPDGAAQCGYCGAALMPAPVVRRTSGLAIASLVSSLTCIGSLLGLVLGIISLRQISRRRDELTGSGMAIAGICISSIMVVGFIPLMAAMLFPVFGRAREAARKTQCIANVKNMAIAVNMYATDYDAFPGQGGQWAEPIEDYVKNNNVFKCPSAPNARSAFAYWDSLEGAQTADIPAPEDQIAVFESDKGWDAFDDLSALPKEPRHLGGDNYGFADGHAKWVARDTAESGDWPPADTHPVPPEKPD